MAVHARAAKATAEGKLSPRASIMLGLVLDIKNNKRKDKASGPAAVLSPAVVKWLKQSHVGQVQLKGLTWQKLLTKNKKVPCIVPLSKSLHFTSSVTSFTSCFKQHIVSVLSHALLACPWCCCAIID